MKNIWGLLFLLLAGCSTYSLVKPGQVKVNDLYSVEPNIQWSQFKHRGNHYWTYDGAGLESVRFINGIQEGEPLLTLKGNKHPPIFHANMSETEIEVAIVDVITLSGANQVKVKDLRPERFGTLNGFRFEMQFLTVDGLSKEGIVVGAVDNEKLYAIIYTGSKIHYFPKYLDEFESIIDSIQIHKRI